VPILKDNGLGRGVVSFGWNQVVLYEAEVFFGIIDG
jgi:hypothetical protein